MTILFKRRLVPPRYEAQPSPPVGVTAADVVASIEMILGRTPDDGLVDYHLAMGFKDRFALGEYMMSTSEFRARNSTPARQPIFLGDRVLGFTHRNEPIYLVPADLDLTPPILFHGTFEPHVERVIAGTVRPGDIAIDIGTNVGFHALVIAARVGPEGRVHAFEANPEVMKLFKATMVLNGYTTFRGTGRVTLYQIAASDRAGTLVLEQAPGHFGSGHIITDAPDADFGPEYSARVEVPTVAIDDLLGGTIEKLDFLHMDIEGAEPLAMRGARALIERSPTLRIVTEWSVNMMRTVADVEAHISWLEGEGFRFWVVHHGGEIQSVSTAELIHLQHCDLFISRQDPPDF
jgi:FkbM family methyltransferase